MSTELPITIGIISDLHAEFWSNTQTQNITAKVQANLAGADLILLPGDIDNGTFSIRLAQSLFPTSPVCFVAGNHEFYHRSYEETVQALQEAAIGTNVAFLHNNSYTTTIHGRLLRVLGTTLWTDFNLFSTPDLSMLSAHVGLNDFRLIQYQERLITPQDVLAIHQMEKAWLLTELAKPFDGLTVVMTHHAPVSCAIQARFVSDRLSPCFASKLEADLWCDDLALVCWGHTHHSVNETIGKTKFVSSQTGYVTGTESVETGDFGILVTL